MKITNKQLKQIIKEELRNILSEQAKKPHPAGQAPSPSTAKLTGIANEQQKKLWNRGIALFSKIIKQFDERTLQCMANENCLKKMNIQALIVNMKGLEYVAKGIKDHPVLQALVTMDKASGGFGRATDPATGKEL